MIRWLAVGFVIFIVCLACALFGWRFAQRGHANAHALFLGQSRKIASIEIQGQGQHHRIRGPRELTYLRDAMVVAEQVPHIFGQPFAPYYDCEIEFEDGSVASMALSISCADKRIAFEMYDDFLSDEAIYYLVDFPEPCPPEVRRILESLCKGRDP